MIGCPSSLIGDGPVSLSEGLLILQDEHAPLRKQLEAIFSLCTAIEEGKEVSFEKLTKEVYDFSTKLEHHSEREENYLFRMMEVHIGKEGGPIAVMEYEHERAKGFISEFLQKAEKTPQPDFEEGKKNIELVKNAYHTLLDHFAKEEQVLYPMAERLFSQEEKELLKQNVLK